MRARSARTARWLAVLAVAVAAAQMLGSAPADALVANGGGAPARGAATARPPEIVGGTPAAQGQYPFAVAVLDDHGDGDDGVPLISLICAGALISPDTVVTAAHCLIEATAGGLASIPPGRLTIAAGDPYLNVGFAGERLPVRRVRFHPGFDPLTLAADVAVLQLAEDAAEAPVALAGPGQEGLWSTGTTATAMGWGFQGNGLSQSDSLLDADTPIISDAECDQAYGSDYQASTMVCAGDLATGSVSCSGGVRPGVPGGLDGNQGEGGGPLIVDDAGTPLLVGVTSWNDFCGVPLYPGVYARVAALRDFLDPYLDPDTVPDAPRRLTSTVSRASASVQWRPPYFDGGTVITGYRVRVRGGAAPTVVEVVPGARSVDLPALAPGIYTVVIRARNAVGLGARESVGLLVP